MADPHHPQDYVWVERVGGVKASVACSLFLMRLAIEADIEPCQTQSSLLDQRRACLVALLLCIYIHTYIKVKVRAAYARALAKVTIRSVCEFLV